MQSSLGANDPALRKPGYQLGFLGRHVGHADFLRELVFISGSGPAANFCPVFAAKTWVNAKPANVRKVAHLGDVVMLKSIWASNSRVEGLKDKPRLRMCFHKYFVMIFAVYSGERKQSRFS